MRFRAWSDEEIERRLSLEENFKPLTDGLAHFIVDDAEESLEPMHPMIFSPEPKKMVIGIKLFIWNDEGGSGIKSFYFYTNTASSHKCLKEFLRSIGKDYLYNNAEISPEDFIGESSDCIIKFTKDYFVIEQFI